MANKETNFWVRFKNWWKDYWQYPQYDYASHRSNDYINSPPYLPPTNSYTRKNYYTVGTQVFALTVSNQVIRGKIILPPPLPHPPDSVYVSWSNGVESWEKIDSISFYTK